VCELGHKDVGEEAEMSPMSTEGNSMCLKQGVHDFSNVS